MISMAARVHEATISQKREDVQITRGYFKKLYSLARTKVRQLGRMFKKKHHTPPPPPPLEAERGDQIPISTQVSSTDELRLRGTNPLPETTVVDVGTLAAATDEAPPPAAAPAIGGAIVRRQSLNTIVVMVREMELGKVLLTIGAGAIGFLIINHEKLDKLIALDFVLTGLVFGFGSILVGIVIRKLSPKPANVIEQVGIVVMLMSFNALVASALPFKFAWVVIIFGGFYVSPFVVAIFFHAPADDDDQQIRTQTTD